MPSYKDMMYEVIYNFSPGGADQISLTVGDVIAKSKDVGNGWLLGKNKTTRKNGLFPADYVKEKAQSKKKNLGRFTAKPKLKKNNIEYVGKPNESPNESEENQYHKMKQTDDGIEQTNEGKNFKSKIQKSGIVTMVRKIFSTPSHEYRVVKGLLGILAGLLSTGVLFVLLTFSYDIPMPVAGGIAAVCGVVMCIALALTTKGRAVGLLVVPSFSTGKGRAAIFSVIAGLLLSGPILNITNNAQEIAISLACNTELAYNKTKELQELAAAPLRAIVNQIQDSVKKIKALGRGITGPLQDVEDGIKKVTKTAKTAAKAFSNAAKTCRKGLDTAYNGCKEGLNSAKKSCKDSIVGGGGRTKIPGIPGIGRKKRSADGPMGPESDSVYLGESQPISSRNKRGACDALDFSKLCKSLKVTDALCKPLDAVDLSITGVTRGIEIAIEQLKNQFVFDIIQTNVISGRANTSQSADEIRSKIENEIREQTQVFHRVLSWITRILSVFLLLVVINSLFYVRSFLTKDKFDNMYITHGMKRADKDRCVEGLPALLPLKKTEKKRYIDSTTVKLSPLEKRSFKVGLVAWLLNVIVGVIVITFDILLFWIISVVRKHSGVILTIIGDTDIGIKVHGGGTMAAIVREFVTGFAQESQYNSTTDFSVCLPNPHKPMYSMYWAILACYIIALLMIVLQAFFLRLRRKAVAYFYPEREVERVTFLTELILKKRKGLKKKVGKSAKKSVKESMLLEKEGYNVVSKAKKVVLFWKKGDDVKTCVVCKDKISTHLVCSTKGCKGAYCTECFDVCGGVCPICNKI